MKYQIQYNYQQILEFVKPTRIKQIENISWFEKWTENHPKSFFVTFLLGYFLCIGLLITWCKNNPL